MKLIIDGVEVETKVDQSLLEIIREMGLVTGKLSTDPIAAKIGGDIFTLNYIPLRSKDVKKDYERMRVALANSDGRVHLIKFTDQQGYEVYTRTAQFVLFLAIRSLWPRADATMSFTVGSGLYIKVSGAEGFSAEVLREKVDKIVSEDIPLIRKRITTEEAIKYYHLRGEADKARLLSYRTTPTFDIYQQGDYADYFYGEMAPSTGYLRSYDILDADGGFIFVFPQKKSPDRVSQYKEQPHLFSVCNEGKEWGELMECETVADLNELVESGKIRELIRINEALHEKRFSQVADRICERGARAVMLAGPSSSGKTTSANRLSTQLRVHGKKPILMSLDDYYIDRDKIDPGPDGKIDLEHINTIDTELFAQHIEALLKGEEVEIPTFNFKTGRREWVGHKMRLTDRSVIVVEGLHALNPALLPDTLPKNLVFRLFVTPLLPLNLDNHNRIPSSYLRLLRRIVRDYATRGASVARTLDMWQSVRAGEEKWIYPFHENADETINSSTLYELAILKGKIFPLLTEIEPSDECYDQVRSIVKVLNFVHEASDVEFEIPPTSLVREFIGGNTFYR